MAWTKAIGVVQTPFYLSLDMVPLPHDYGIDEHQQALPIWWLTMSRYTSTARTTTIVWWQGFPNNEYIPYFLRKSQEILLYLNELHNVNWVCCKSVLKSILIYIQKLHCHLRKSTQQTRYYGWYQHYLLPSSRSGECAIQYCNSCLSFGARLPRICSSV
jgi:hypothetical protein